MFPHPQIANLSSRQFYHKAPFSFNVWEASFSGSYPPPCAHLFSKKLLSWSLFALVLSARPLSSDFSCLQEQKAWDALAKEGRSIFISGKAGKCVTRG